MGGHRGRRSVALSQDSESGEPRAEGPGRTCTQTRSPCTAPTGQPRVPVTGCGSNAPTNTRSASSRGSRVTVPFVLGREGADFLRGDSSRELRSCLDGNAVTCPGSSPSSSSPLSSRLITKPPAPRRDPSRGLPGSQRFVTGEQVLSCVPPGDALFHPAKIKQKTQTDQALLL